VPGWQGQGEMKWRVGQGGLPLVTRRSRQLRCHLSGGTWVGEGPRPQNDSRNHQSLEKEVLQQQGALGGGLKEPPLAQPEGLGQRRTRGAHGRAVLELW